MRLAWCSIEKREFVRELIDERNALARQVARLEARVVAIDTELAGDASP